MQVQKVDNTVTITVIQKSGKKTYKAIMIILTNIISNYIIRIKMIIKVVTIKTNNNNIVILILTPVTCYY